MSAPERIEAVVHEKRRNAAQKTPERWSVRFGPEVGRPRIRGRAEVRHQGLGRRGARQRLARAVEEVAGRERDDPGAEAAVDPPAEVVERRCHDGDREDVLHRRRHHVLAATGAGFVRHEADVDQPHDADGEVVELLGEDLAVERELVRHFLRGGRLREQRGHTAQHRNDHRVILRSALRTDVAWTRARLESPIPAGNGDE